MCRACIIAEPYFVRYDRYSGHLCFGDTIVLPELAKGADIVVPMYEKDRLVGFVHVKVRLPWS